MRLLLPRACSCLRRESWDGSQRIESLGKPVLAAINGYALGGGCEIALACTLRFASSTARFGQPEVNLGLIPGYGGTQRLSRLVGVGHALDLIVTGRMISAEEALGMGLVSRVVPREELLDHARELAAAVLARGPLATRLAKLVVRSGADADMRTGLVVERLAQALRGHREG